MMNVLSRSILVVGGCAALFWCGCSKNDVGQPVRDEVTYEFDKTPLPADLTWYPATNWVDTIDPVADPNARKGGVIRFNGSQPPKSFNAYVDNNAYTRMLFELMYDNLIGIDTQTLEFVPALARRWAISADGNHYVFEIDDHAYWSDGVKVTSADVKWTFDAVMDRKNDTGPWKSILADFESPRIIDERTVWFTKKPGSVKNWRDIQHCGMFSIMPKHAFERYDFNKLDLVGAPVGGAYKIVRAMEQVETEFERVKTWWRKDFPSCKNVCNFDRIVVRYYADNENAFEALKKRAIDVYPVYTARIMKSRTREDVFYRNHIVKRIVRNHRPCGFQGFAMNMRRKPFDDLRVRQAISHLIDRKMMNETMMDNAYFLLNSYWTDIYDKEHPCRNKFYEFDLEEAKRLLKEAGYENGFSFTFLSRSATEDKFLMVFNEALKKCNITMKIERKDFAGWMRDVNAFSFDMTWASYGDSIFKNPETMWLSSEADRSGSNNATGFKSEEVDAIIKAEKEFETAAERNAAYRRIDELIAAQCPYAFLWQTDTRRLLYWNKFGMPAAILGKYSDEDCIFTYWWYDEDKARELEEARTSGGFLPQVSLTVDYDTVMGE